MDALIAGLVSLTVALLVAACILLVRAEAGSRYTRGTAVNQPPVTERPQHEVTLVGPVVQLQPGGQHHAIVVITADEGDEVVRIVEQMLATAREN